MARVVMRGLNRLAQMASDAFEKHLLLSNLTTAGVLLGIGDIMEQQLFQRLVKWNTGEGVTMDWRRNGRMVIVGCGQGLIMHVCYDTFLDRFLPGTALKTIIKKTAIDSTMCVPVQYAGLFISASMLEGESFKDSFWSFIDKFPIVYAVDCAYWIPAQLINFRFVPPKYRVVYISTLSIIHNIFLVWMQHSYGKDKEPAQEGETHAQHDGHKGQEERESKDGQMVRDRDKITVSGA